MFMLFVFEEYEERGGWKDFVGIFDSVSAAKAHEEGLRQSYARNNGQIVEVATMRVVSTLDTHRIGELWEDWEHRWTDLQPSSP